MAYYTKEEYRRKAEYAYGKSTEGITMIAAALGVDEEELEPIARLSHTRHKIHSTAASHFACDSSELAKVGTQYSDGSMIDDVNALNRKYKLVDGDIPCIHEPEVEMSVDSDEDIMDYYDKATDGMNDDDIHAEAYDLICCDWAEIIDQWSDAVRQWFGKLNERFGTDFPD